MKIALGIQYDGTPFSGWQVQHFPVCAAIPGNAEPTLRGGFSILETHILDVDPP